MRKIIAAINMTIDGVCDHAGMEPDEEVHDHYRQLLDNAGVILYGSITFQLMKFWQELLRNPSGEKSMDEFAMAIDNIPKIVFSSTLQDTAWSTAQLSDKPLKEKVVALQQEPGKDILVGSRSLIIQLLKLDLVDELQLCVHPIIAGTGLQLFDHMNERSLLTLLNTKTFSSGAVILYYQPVSGNNKPG